MTDIGRRHWTGSVGWSIVSGIAFALVGWALSLTQGQKVQHWPWVAVGAVIGVAFMLILYAPLRSRGWLPFLRPVPEGPSLADRAEALSKELYEFVGQRQRDDPSNMMQTHDFLLPPEERRRRSGEWAAMSQTYMQETKIRYDQQFAARALAIWDEAVKAGMEKPEAGWPGTIHYPTNWFGYNGVAQRIGAIAHKARSMDHG